MSHRLVVVALVAVLVLAGCGGLGSETAETTTESTATEERVIAPPPSENETTTAATSGTTETTTATTRTTTSTTIESYNRGLSYEVRASNADGTVRNVTITIAPENGSTPVFDDSMHLAPNESREFDFEFPHVGEYEVTVRVGNQTLTRRWEVEVRDPDRGLSVYVAADGEVHVGFVAI